VNAQTVGWAKRSVPTTNIPLVMVGTLRFAHPKIVKEPAI
jgi:hypothetical protein